MALLESNMKRFLKDVCLTHSSKSVFGGQKIPLKYHLVFGALHFSSNSGALLFSAKLKSASAKVTFGNKGLWACFSVLPKSCYKRSVMI